jgi:hypothetical protein
MLPLLSSKFPDNAAELRLALEAGLRTLLDAPTEEMVSLTEKEFPDLKELRAVLDGAKLRAENLSSHLIRISSDTTPAFRVERLALSADPLLINGAPLRFSLEASDVAIHQTRSQNDRFYLVMQHAAEGHVESSIAVRDLESLVGSIAKTAAEKEGVRIDEVSLKISARGERSLGAEVQLRARKLFLSAVIRITGQLEIDNQLTARLSGLACVGEGALGALACNFLTPHLQRANGREFSLVAIPLGGIKLRDIRVAAGNDLTVRAQFGAAT